MNIEALLTKKLADCCYELLFFQYTQVKRLYYVNL